MNACYMAATCGALLATLACAAAAQTIEITSPSIGTVTVRPQPIAKQPAARLAPSEVRSAGVDLGIRRNRDGTLYDALDPRQNPAAATADNAVDPARNNAAGEMPARGAAARAGAIGISGGRADFPYGVNGAQR